MVQFVAEKGLVATFPYIDFAVGGHTREEHDENVNWLLRAYK